MGPLSTSDENASVSTSLSSQHHAGDDSTSSCTTTTESFIQQRLRHTSMPQARVCSSAGLVQHDHLEASLSHEASSASHTSKHHHHFFSSRHHATITSNSAASLESAHGGASAACLNVPIVGKNLSLRLKKGQIDKAHKDKACRTFPDNFSVTLFLVKPEDQSDNLLDYSLYSTALLMSMDSHSTITTMNNHQHYANDKFTVMPVLSNPANQRQRPGQSGDSSSTTPSLKSTEQSSQDSVASSGSDNESDIQTSIPKCPHTTTAASQPQSTAI